MRYHFILFLIVYSLCSIHSLLNTFHQISKIRKQTIFLLSLEDDNVNILPSPSLILYHHHTSIRTSNIEASIKFYSLLGFEIECKFRSGPARSAWLIIPNSSLSKQTRIELIEVPSYMLSQSSSKSSKAIDVVNNPTNIGYNHLCLDVTNSTSSLVEWMESLNSTSYARFKRTIRTAIPVQEQLIGSNVYDVGWIYDADGAAIELIYWKSQLDQIVQSGWEPLGTLEWKGIQ